jgi:hypothetical protein
MAAGYDANQIKNVVDAAYALNDQLQTLKLPENFKVKDRITVSLNVGTHHIADITIYVNLPNNTKVEPHIAFIN